jgi:MYXO-CTERM domain-containing protein
MKCIYCVLLAALAAVGISCSQATAQNLLTDPSFENPALYTADGPPFVGSWEAFNGGPGTFSVNDTLMPNSGARDAHLNITATNNSFAGFFQDVPVTPGVLYTYSGFHKSANLNPADYVSEVRFEWRNSVSNTEVSRNQILPIAGAQYTPFSLTFPAPAGADIGRIVYAIQTFSDTGTTNTGDVFVDDLSVTGVPEPSAIALAGLGGLALLRRRRTFMPRFCRA